MQRKLRRYRFGAAPMPLEEAGLGSGNELETESEGSLADALSTQQLEAKWFGVERLNVPPQLAVSILSQQKARERKHRQLQTDAGRRRGKTTGPAVSRSARPNSSESSIVDLTKLVALQPEVDAGTAPLNTIPGSFTAKEIKGPAPLLQRINHTIVTYEGSMYVFGGRQSCGNLGQYSNSIYVFLAARNQWTEVPVKGQPPTKRGDHTAVIHDSKMIIVGGRKHMLMLDDMAAFDFLSGAWQRITYETRTGPGALFGHSAALSGEKMYVVGGVHKEEWRSLVHCFDCKRNYWTKIAGPADIDPNGLYHAAAVCTSDSLVVVGLHLEAAPAPRVQSPPMSGRDSLNWSVQRRLGAPSRSVLLPGAHIMNLRSLAWTFVAMGVEKPTPSLSALPPQPTKLNLSLSNSVYLEKRGLWCFLILSEAPSQQPRKLRTISSDAPPVLSPRGSHAAGSRMVTSNHSELGQGSNDSSSQTLYVAMMQIRTCSWSVAPVTGGALGSAAAIQAVSAKFASEFETKYACVVHGEAVVLMGGTEGQDYCMCRLIPTAGPANPVVSGLSPFGSPVASQLLPPPAASRRPSQNAGLDPQPSNATFASAAKRSSVVSVVDPPDNPVLSGGGSLLVGLNAMPALPTEPPRVSSEASLPSKSIVAPAVFLPHHPCFSTPSTAANTTTGCPVVRLTGPQVTDWASKFYHSQCEWLVKEKARIIRSEKNATSSASRKRGVKPQPAPPAKGPSTAPRPPPLANVASVPTKVTEAEHTLSLARLRTGVLLWDAADLAFSKEQLDNPKLLVGLRWEMVRNYVMSGQAVAESLQMSSFSAEGTTLAVSKQAKRQKRHQHVAGPPLVARTCTGVGSATELACQPALVAQADPRKHLQQEYFKFRKGRKGKSYDELPPARRIVHVPVHAVPYDMSES